MPKATLLKLVILVKVRNGPACLRTGRSLQDPQCGVLIPECNWNISRFNLLSSALWLIPLKRALVVASLLTPSPSRAVFQSRVLCFTSILSSLQCIALLMARTLRDTQLHCCVVAVTKFHCQPAQSRTKFQSTDCCFTVNALSLALGESTWYIIATGYTPTSASPFRPPARVFITASTRVLVPFRKLACSVLQARLVDHVALALYISPATDSFRLGGFCPASGVQDYTVTWPYALKDTQVTTELLYSLF